MTSRRRRVIPTDTPSSTPTTSPSTTPDSTEKKAKKPRQRIKSDHFETRLFYNDYTRQQTRDIVAMANGVIARVLATPTTITPQDTTINGDASFYMEIGEKMKEELAKQWPNGAKWCCVVGNDFGMVAEAMSNTIMFFGVGDVKLLIYQAPSK